MRLKLFALAALLALAGTAFAALSSDQALDIVGGKKGYLNDGESAKLLLATPIEINGEGYWVAYFYQTSAPDTKNLFMAVSDSTGFVERDPAALTGAFQIAAKLALLDVLKQGQASLDDVSNFLTSAKAQQQATAQGFYQVRLQLEAKYPSVSFDAITTGLQDISDANSQMENDIRETRSLKGQFELYGTDADFNAYFNAYNATLEEFNGLSLKVERYQATVLAKVDEVTNSPDLNFTAKQEINSALEKAYDVGDYKGFATSTVEPAQRLIASQLARQDTLVANNVESTLFRISKKNADYAYTSGLKSDVDAVLASAREPELRACGIDVTDLKKAWGQLRGVMENPSNATRTTYDAIPEQASKVQELANTATQALNGCRTGVTPEPKRVDNSNVLTNAVIILVIAGLAYYGYTRYKKWREESE